MTTDREVRKQAADAAAERPEADEPIAWSAAMAEAPLPKRLPTVWEPAFRKAYAAALVKRGIAKPAGRSGKSGPSGESKLSRRTLRASDEEFEAQDRKAQTAGVPWGTWVRRKLAEP